jgi:hypothetical protein
MLRRIGLKANDTNTDIQVCSLHGTKSLRQDIAWVTKGGKKRSDCYDILVSNPAGEKSPMKKGGLWPVSKGIGKTRITLKQLRQANEILHNQLDHEQFSHVGLAMYHATNNERQNGNAENVPPINPTIAL